MLQQNHGKMSSKDVGSRKKWVSCREWLRESILMTKMASVESKQLILSQEDESEVVSQKKRNTHKYKYARDKK